ncbi:hypothetical protein KIP69_11565 [Geobacter sulfurreducens]|uniref:hypothetical protein n=1 Tax=Geobacter sulfurreducens TaxID=35554 RepID=UPI001BDCF9AA|nr:hypothetical protein [Geobacter sulfurreducens]QVW34231.1 hypothetical protein KIP69_11565 [Geobacter sulfurreducens]
MSEHPDEKLKKLVNSSGFPLQIAISHHIYATWQTVGWKVILNEHPWQHPESGDSGFIDLVVEDYHKTQVMVVECKRVRDTEWIFLIPKENPNPRAHVNTWFTYTKNGATKQFSWVNLTSDPSSYESEFCIVHGQDPKAKPMLERTAAELIDSTEALAFEELSIKKDESEFLRIYTNVIVTTADLKICKFNPEDISLSNGEISTTKFESVPWIRFRKSLTPRPAKLKGATTVTEVAKANERTVFVVNSENFLTFLKEWELGKIPISLYQ